jgi:HEAT repeats
MRAVMRLLSMCGLCLALATGARADARTEFLVRMLTTSSQFRVRAQAALALAAHGSDREVVSALGRGLKDEHPAVRAASVSSLEQIGDARAVALLDPLSRDPDKAVRAAAGKAVDNLRRASAARTVEPSQPPSDVPSEGAAFYVAVGVPNAKSTGLDVEAARELRGHLTSQLLQISGVRIAPENEPRVDAERVIKSKKLAGYHLESSVTALDVRPDGSIRVQVSVVVATYPGRDIRAMLSGGATLQGGSGASSDKLEAVQAAFTGALRRLPQAMQAGLARAP